MVSSHVVFGKQPFPHVTGQVEYQIPGAPKLIQGFFHAPSSRRSVNFSHNASSICEMVVGVVRFASDGFSSARHSTIHKDTFTKTQVTRPAGECKIRTSHD